MEKVAAALEQRWPGNCGNIFFVTFSDIHPASTAYESFIRIARSHRRTAGPVAFFGQTRSVPSKPGTGKEPVVGVMCWDKDSRELRESVEWFADYAAKFPDTRGGGRMCDRSLSEMPTLPLNINAFRLIDV